jgi:2-polyprenyl-3-methyl-5-hydroxy-6-metoxy-1,4-benzoquinol methylase
MIDCPVCGLHNSTEAFRCTDFFVTGELFPIIECNRCHFRWTGKAPSPDDAGRYYQSEAYISHSNTKIGLINRIYHVIRNLMLGRKLNIIGKCSGMKNGSLLDIGAGTGFFLHFMQNKGWKVTGIEKSDEARKFAGDNLHITVLPDSAFLTLPEHAFNIITLWHVMEHLHDLPDYWNKFPGLLTPSGILLIALPNPESSDAKHYREFWAAWDVPRHLWHFSPGNIIQMAEKAGFAIKKIYRMPFDAFYVSMLSEKYKSKGTDLFKKIGSLTPIVKGIFWGFISWMISLFRLKKCSSLIYVFQLK